MFRAFPGPQVADLSDGATRTLTGDGTEFLVASGLKKLEAVWVGSLRLDPEIAFRVQHPHEAESKVTIRVPTYDLSLAPDGTPVLRRNMCSNNGVWQKDCPIHVKGIWEFDPDATERNPGGGPFGTSVPVSVDPPASTIAGLPMGSMTAAEAAVLLESIRAAGFLPEHDAPEEPAVSANLSSSIGNVDTENASAENAGAEATAVPEAAPASTPKSSRSR